jgi:Flp pilus assembly protein TadG
VSTFGLDRLLRSRDGNIAMMYALIAPVLVFAAGGAIDYGRTAQINTKLNAAADAAALTPAMLQQSATVAQAAASAMFTGLADSVSGLLTKNATKVTVTITAGANPLIRNVEVSYTTSVNTIFAQVLGVAQLSVKAPRRRARRRRRTSTFTFCSTIPPRWGCRRRPRASRKWRTSL